MRVFVTGATGFVGRWLAEELTAAGHEVIASPSASELSITDAPRLLAALTDAKPDAIAHLAAVSFAPDAANDPSAAIATNVAGTSLLLRAARQLESPPVVLLVSSSEVYGSPAPEDLPITEEAPLRPRHVYGVSKLGQEATALWSALRDGLRITIARPFNHTGPGQRPVFAIPAFVQRVLALRSGEATEIRAGNVEVRRDIGDVRDVVRAYRLMLEHLRSGDADSPSVFNIATGRAVAVRDVIDTLCRLAGIEPRITIDPALVRIDDPALIIGNAGALHAAVGWSPNIPLEATLADMLADPDHRPRSGETG